MVTDNNIEYLCPHCMVTNSHIQIDEDQQNIEIKVRCTACFKPFEIILAEGIEGKCNAVVND